MMRESEVEIREQIKQRFIKVACLPDTEQKFPTGPESAKSLEYDPNVIDALPASVTESFCGVGNPLALGELHSGQIVIDLGSGAGLDSILAARGVGPAGRVIGIDMTQEMIDKAMQNTDTLRLTNVEFRQGQIESLPVDDDTVDVVITNGVFNLSIDKPKVLAEVFRVLRPGGGVQMADILVHADVTPEQVAEKGAWSD